jgi:hypothetical protein
MQRCIITICYCQRSARGWVGTGLQTSPNSSTLVVTANKFEKYLMLHVQIWAPDDEQKNRSNVYSVDNNKEYYATLHLVGHA